MSSSQLPPTIPMRQTFNPTSQGGDTNANYMTSLNRPSLHATSIVSGLATLGEDNPIYIPCNFPVREIIIRANYSIVSTAPDSFYATCNCPAFANGEIIMGFNGSICYNPTVGQLTYATVGSFNQSVMRYLLRQPMILQGSWQWQLHAAGGTAPNADIVLDFELLG